MLTNREFERIVEFIKRKSGIDLNEKKVLVQGRLDNYIQKNGYQSYHEFMDLVERFPTGAEAEVLLNALTTNHTYFWREYEQFLYLKQVVMPKLKAKEASTKDWRIWCAASSSGEEPYTLAMLCMDFLGLEHPEWDTTILATDIDTSVLEKAVRGVYNKDSVENLPRHYVRRFFRVLNENEYQVRDDLKRQVIFRKFNLMDSILMKRRRLDFWKISMTRWSREAIFLLVLQNLLASVIVNFNIYNLPYIENSGGAYERSEDFTGNGFLWT